MQYGTGAGMHFRFRDDLEASDNIESSPMSLFVEDPSRTTTIQLIWTWARSLLLLVFLEDPPPSPCDSLGTLTRSFWLFR